uniref:Glutathione S-transferase kappa n=1 Tax=Diaphanosoma celebensis TaxID=2184134 RepID=A0A6B7GBC9_9CRUS|nr:glutathione S-transferase kappa [Diaphanosoma celebensis]QST14954.1 GSTkappa2 protein [Diaphanosoma celebensis]
MASLLRTKVEFFYDVVSPYTWFGFETLCRYRPHWNMELVLRPFFLGGIMKQSGNRPPMMVPAKALHMNTDLKRNAAYFQVPLKVVEDPFHVLVEKGSLRAQRLLTAVKLNNPRHLEEVTRQLWIRIWSEGTDITQNNSFWQAGKKAKMDDEDIEKCIKLVDDPVVKKTLIDTTEEAIEYGAFGAPTIVVHSKSGSEMFFGSDRFPLIAMYMNAQWKGPNPNPRD